MGARALMGLIGWTQSANTVEQKAMGWLFSNLLIPHPFFLLRKQLKFKIFLKVYRTLR